VPINDQKDSHDSYSSGHSEYKNSITQSTEYKTSLYKNKDQNQKLNIMIGKINVSKDNCKEKSEEGSVYCKEKNYHKDKEISKTTKSPIFSNKVNSKIKPLTTIDTK